MREHRETVHLTQPFFFFPYSSLLMTKHQRIQRQAQSPLKPPCSQAPALGGRCKAPARRATPALRRGSRSWGSDAAVEPDRCLLTAPTMHLGRAARERNIFYCDSLISRVQAVFSTTPMQVPKIWMARRRYTRSPNHGRVGTHSHSTSKTGGQLDLLLLGPSGNLSALGRLRPPGIATAR